MLDVATEKPGIDPGFFILVAGNERKSDRLRYHCDFPQRRRAGKPGTRLASNGITAEHRVAQVSWMDKKHE